MNTNVYKERNKRIFKLLAVLFVVMGFVAICSWVAFYGTDLAKNILLIVAGILIGCCSIFIFIKARPNKIEAGYNAAAVAGFIAGLVNVYFGIQNILRFLNR